MSALSKTEISMKSTDYATIKLTCRPNLLNSRPQRIGFYSTLEIPACIQWLTDFKLGARVSKIHDRISITHALVFIIFSGCATLECRCHADAGAHEGSARQGCPVDRWRHRPASFGWAGPSAGRHHLIGRHPGGAPHRSIPAGGSKPDHRECPPHQPRCHT